MMGFVENEKRSCAKFAKHIAQASCIDLVGEEAVGNNKAGTGRPWVDRSILVLARVARLRANTPGPQAQSLPARLG